MSFRVRKWRASAHGGSSAAFQEPEHRYLSTSVMNFSCLLFLTMERQEENLDYRKPWSYIQFYDLVIVFPFLSEDMIT